MHAKRPTKYLPDGTVNPKWKPHASGRNRSMFERGKFLAWDGEGINVNAPVNGAQQHNYIYLANSNGNEIYDRDGLSTKACFNLMLDEAKANPNCIHVIFGGSYDVNNMFKDILKAKLEDIATSSNDNAVIWGRYAIKYTPRKSLFLARFKPDGNYFTKDKSGKNVPNYDVSFTLWDVIGFFQDNFINTVDKWLGKDYEHYNLIAEGKEKRHAFNTVTVEYLREYNSAELITLVDLMQRLQSALLKLELPIKRWDGAGSIATAMCTKHNVKQALGTYDAIGKWTKLELPAPIQTATQHAYFGGRIELIQYGYHPSKVYHYDINSAYPFIQSTLPSLTSGKWKHHKKPHIDSISSFSIFLVKWNTPWARICPFPYRSEMQRKILYPENGLSWVWYPEVITALNAANTIPSCSRWSISLLECWEFIPDDTAFLPYSFILPYYESRRKMVQDSKADGILRGEEKVIKLGINSLYGKTAQHVGFNVQEGRIPALHNLAYAGYVTSGTRAMIFNACITNPDSIIAIATDGIFSTQPLDLSISKTKELGKWDVTIHDSMVMVQSGFYWLLDGVSWKGWSRGFDRVVGTGKNAAQKEKSYQTKMFSQVKHVLNAWESSLSHVYFDCTRFITLNTALVSERWFKRWRTWYSMGHDLYAEGKQPQLGRMLKLNPSGTKRIDDISNLSSIPNPAHSLVKTLPVDNHTPSVLSSIYILPWTYAENDIDEVEGIPINIIDIEHSDSYL